MKLLKVDTLEASLDKLEAAMKAGGKGIPETEYVPVIASLGRTAAEDVLCGENIPGFDTISDIIRAHHEKWDGTGYPKRLKGQNIPIGARIVAVANYYDRNINPCTSHWQKTHADAIVELQNKAGLDFDPTIVKAFIESVLPQPNRNEI